MVRRIALVAVLLGAALSIVWSAVAAPRVLPRLRVAPGFGLIDASGAQVSSDSLRGQVLLITFGPADCDAQCQARSAMLAQSIVAAGEANAVTPVWIVAEPIEREGLAALAGSLAATPVTWRVLGTSDARRLELVLEGFRVPRQPEGNRPSVDPVVIVVDPVGIVRAEYRTTPAPEALATDLQTLAAEIRGSRGARRYLYEAAHLFTCNLGGA
jgi:protein SCO1/2